jgi:tetratricopeptide (TPR) repeat protein
VATIADLIARPELLGPSRSEIDWYRAAYPVVEADPPAQPWRAVLDLVRGVLARLPDAAIDRVQDLYLSLPPPTYTAKSDAPLTFTSPDARLYFRARNYHVFLRTAEASAGYAQLVRDYPDSPYVDDARYQLGQLDLTQARDAWEAARELQSLLDSDPETPWRGDARYLQARALDFGGQCALARDLYAEVAQGESNGLEDARARLGSLVCA